MNKFFMFVVILLLPQMVYANNNFYLGIGTSNAASENGGQKDDSVISNNAYSADVDEYNVLPGTGMVLGYHGKQLGVELRRLSYELDTSLRATNLVPEEYTETTVSLVSRIGWERFVFRFGAGVGQAKLAVADNADDPKTLSVGGGFAGFELTPGKAKDVRFFVDYIYSQASFRDRDTTGATNDSESRYRQHSTIFAGVFVVLGRKKK